MDERLKLVDGISKSTRNHSAAPGFTSVYRFSQEALPPDGIAAERRVVPVVFTTPRRTPLAPLPLTAGTAALLTAARDSLTARREPAVPIPMV
jgi:hypothetical protein